MAANVLLVICSISCAHFFYVMYILCIKLQSFHGAVVVPGQRMAHRQHPNLKLDRDFNHSVIELAGDEE